MTGSDLVAAAVRRAAPEPDVATALRAVRRRHRRRRVVIGSGAVAAVLFGTVAALVLDGIDGQDEPITPSSQEEGWQILADPPFGQEFAPVASVWTGEEAIWWGGRGDIGREWGAAYDPGADSWRVMADSPLAARQEESVVWTGDEMVVWGGHPEPFEGYEERGAAYDPASDRWRVIAPAPMETRGGAIAGWVGSEMIVVGGRRADGPPECSGDGTCSALPSARWLPDGAAYDPSTDTWRPIALIPLNLGDTFSVTSTANELLVFNGLASLAYDVETDRWRSISLERADGEDVQPLGWLLADGGVGVAVDTSLVLADDGISDDGVLTAGEAVPQEDAFFLYRPEVDRWEPAPRGLPRAATFPRCELSLTAVGDAVVLLGCTQAVIDPATGTWRSLPVYEPEGGRPGDVVVSGVEAVGSDDFLMVLDPASPAVTEWPRFLGYRFSEPPP